ncbi:PIR Superfamily Protein [Plasmodium ovale curtisi]|uniref:PIR Superfamily Protein n=1 Tax=Plasmodium ovale curtisi TaxID=864141 RepID=A0A1A8X725_PLAOA|nr:PIR Superfamily Protein [Plasmodium ovale curtisi]
MKYIFLLYHFLETLHPFTLYREFNVNSTSDQDENYFSIVNSQYPEKSHVLKLCKKLIRNLEKTNTMQKDEYYLKECCEYLNYWILDKVINNYNINKNTLYDS